MSGDVEFRLETDLAVIENTPIEANFDEMKSALTTMMQPYASMVVTLETVSTAKTDRARIRKVASRIDETRKTVKRIYTAPLKAFEDKCKELTAICDAASKNLDEQVRDFDERRATAKIDELRDFFEEQVGEADGYIEFDDIFNPRWKNVSFSIDDAKTEIVKKIEECEDGIDAIRALHSEFETTLLEEFRANHDLARCLKKNERLLAVKELELKQKQRKEQERARTMPISVPPNSKPYVYTTATAYPEAPEPAEEIDPPGEEEELHSVVFRVTATDRQLAALKEFLKHNNIQYGRA